MCTIGILGIVLMIIENELSFTRLNDSDTQASWFIKLVITLSTAVLVGLIVYYHRLDLDLFCNQNSLNDWRIGLSVKRVAWILLEIAICVVHPVPRLYPSSHPPPINQNATDPVPLSYTPTDVGLGLPSKWHIHHFALHSLVIVSVPSYLLAWPLGHVPFLSGARWIGAITRLSQSCADQLLFPPQNLSRAMAHTVHALLLHRIILHRKLVSSGMQLPSGSRASSHRRCHVAVHCHILHYRLVYFIDPSLLSVRPSFV